MEHPCGALWSSCGTGKGMGGLRMVRKGEEELWGSLVDSCPCLATLPLQAMDAQADLLPER